MGEVQLISTSLIQPTSCRHEQYSILDRIDLTPWDLPFIWIGPIQKGLLFSKPIPSPPNSDSDSHQTDNFSVDHLKTSFSRTLEFFPLLAARFSAVKNHDDGGDDTTTSFFIDCKVNAGAEFVHAVADHLTVADVVQPKYVPRVVHSFFPLNGVKNHEGTSKPLLAVQVTELADGYFIGCSMNHTVGDGSSFWHFINSWSEIARGSGTISRPPVLQRWFPDDHDTLCPIRLRLREEQLNHHLAPSPYEERIFHITRAKIAELKSRANSEMGVSNLSSLQSLMAHLWRSIARCQRLCPDEQTRCLLFVGARPRLRPPLPENYYGNAVKFTIVTAAAGELLEEGLGWAATQINAEIASFTDEEIRKSYRSWGERPEPMMLAAAVKNGLGLSSSPRFDMYGNDFGWGAPVAVRSGMANKCPGKVTVFEGKEEGSIDLEACLSPETLQAMEDDAEFMEVFS